MTTMESAPAIGARLPRRPRLARGIGVYLREGDEVQVGLDPRHAVVLSDVPCTVAGIVRALDGRDTLPALLRSAGAYAGELRTVLHTLVARGLVTECTPAGAATPESTVVVHGDGPLAAAVAVLLAAVGVHRVVPECAGIVSPREAGRTLLPYDVGLRRRSAVEAAMRAVDPAVTTGAPTSSRTPDLVVLTDALVPPPELVHRLMADRRPHLLARFRDGIGVVGPLVLPGRSSCLHCADLHRAGRDASWPLIAGQLAGRVQLAEPITTEATAALTVAQALRALEPAASTTPPLWNATLELDPFAGITASHEWPPHPRCRCGAFRG